jgi:hypothetical protein
VHNNLLVHVLLRLTTLPKISYHASVLINKVLVFNALSEAFQISAKSKESLLCRYDIEQSDYLC